MTPKEKAQSSFKRDMEERKAALLNQAVSLEKVIASNQATVESNYEEVALIDEILARMNSITYVPYPTS